MQLQRCLQRRSTSSNLALTADPEATPTAPIATEISNALLAAAICSGQGGDAPFAFTSAAFAPTAAAATATAGAGGIAPAPAAADAIPASLAQRAIKVAFIGTVRRRAARARPPCCICMPSAVRRRDGASSLPPPKSPI